MSNIKRRIVSDEELKKTMSELLSVYSREELAVAVKKSSQTIQAWAMAKNQPSFAEYKILYAMLSKKLK